MRYRRQLWLLLAVAAAALAAAHDGHKPLPARGMEVYPQTGRLILTAKARSNLDVQTTEVIAASLTSSFPAYGTVVAPWNQHAVVNAPLSGRIVELLAEPGQTVAAGQPLAIIDSPELDSLLLEIHTARVSLELSRKLLLAAQTAAANGSIPRIRTVEADNEVQRNAAALDMARARWLSLLLPPLDFDKILSTADTPPRRLFPLLSPISGTVTHGDLSVGRIVTPNEHLFEILDLSTVWLRINVPENHLPRVSLGQKLSLKLTTHPDHPLDSTVDVLGRQIDSSSQMATIWATFKNPTAGGFQLLPGMTGLVRLYDMPTQPVPTIPAAALIHDGAERFVLVEQEQTSEASTFRRETIVAGRRQGTAIELRGGGVFPGDRVVTQGSHVLGPWFARGVLRVSPETAADIGLQVQPIEQIPLQPILTVDGMVEIPASARTVASAQLGGTLAAVLADRGQPVEAGQILAEVVSQDFQNLQLQFLQTDLNTELLQKIVASLAEARDAVSQRRLLETESQLILARSQRETLLRKLTTAGLSSQQLEDLEQKRTLVPRLPVRAPISGVLIDFDTLLGQIVQPEDPLFEIHDPSKARILGFVSERDSPQIRSGQPVRLRLHGRPGSILTGTVSGTGQSLGSQDRTMLLWAELQSQPAEPLLHGMFASLTIETGAGVPAFAVPHEAIVREGSRAFVFVRDPSGIFERRSVRTGRSDDFSVELLEGISAGEVVAMTAAQALQTAYAALR
ncbi:MAG TPA: hypothetical protein DC058_04425 [Planctomycetaceae bacterium]|nr:hypothetical protein [Planctomycetaceae bacterium]